VYWILLAQDMDQLWAVVDTVVDLPFLETLGNCLTSWATTSFSRRYLHRGISYKDNITTILELPSAWGRKVQRTSTSV